MTYPSVPLGNQWTHPNLEADTDMHAKIDTPLNNARNSLLALNRSSMPSLRVALRTSGRTVAVNGKIPYDTVLQDSAGGWNAGSFTYSVSKSGWYLVSMQAQSSTTAAWAARISGLNTADYPTITELIAPNPENTGSVAGIAKMPGTPLYLRIGAIFCVYSAQALTLTGQVTASGVTADLNWLNIIGLSVV